jgi:lipopolysaccharide transport system ATP-binding protein
MRMRLAFAVAAHLEPEILIVDEVLAVGDAAFQKKCLGRMETVTGQGRTVLFVSHNMPAVRRLCSQGVLLRDGRLIKTGPVDDVLAEYDADITLENELVFPESETKAASVTRLCIKNSRGEKTTRFLHTETFITEVEYVLRSPSRVDRLWWQLDTADGIRVMGSVDLDSPDTIPQVREPGRYIATIVFPARLLNEGIYQYRVAIGPVIGDLLDYRYGCYFEIEDDTDFFTTATGRQRHGVILQRLQWHERKLESLNGRDA